MLSKSPSKYQTIDPMILETLNLNQRRMHHIFDILHGRADGKQQIKNKKYGNNDKYKTLDYAGYSQSQRKRDQYDNSIEKQIKIKEKLPSIKQVQNNKYFDERIRKRKQTQKNNNNSVAYSSDRQINSNIPLTLQSRRHNSLKSKIKQQQNSYSLRKSITKNNLQEQQYQLPSNKLIKNNRRATSIMGMNDQKEFIVKEMQKLSIKKSNNINQAQPRNPSTLRMKTKQLISDYFTSPSISKSKSLQLLNPKDIYRLQIQQVLQQLTPIEKIQQAQKRMKRIKKRYGHLKSFDQKYYSKLNQMEFIRL